MNIRLLRNMSPLLSATLLLMGCDGKEKFEYPAPMPVTEIGKSIVDHSSLIVSLYEDKSYDIAEGVEVTELSYMAYNGKPMRMFFFKIDLGQDNITISNTTPFNKPIGNGKEIMTEQAKHVDAPGFKVLGGSNTDFGSDTQSKPQGIFHHEGVCHKSTFNALPARPRSFFYLTKDKKAFTAPASAYGDVASSGVIQEAFGGGPVLVADGETINIPDPDDLSVEPRTSIGVSEDGKTVYIMVVDGRRYTYSNGMSFHDMSLLMRSVGCWSAINLDGGGSSTFFVREKDDFSDPDRFKVLNWPNDDGGHQREVYCGLVIVEKE